MADESTDLLIAGGGPAGMMAGRLFARAGVRTLVVEKHADFLRDFRGDTVHPATLRLFHELGLLERLLARPHDKVRTIGAFVGETPVEVADFSWLDPRWGFITMMPQWEFLDFVKEEAQRYPDFRLRMACEATGLLVDDDRVVGATCREGGAERAILARLVIAADGRESRLRTGSGLKLRALGAPIDVFWFRLPKARTPENDSTGVLAGGRILAMIDRGDYWQCAYVFTKGQADQLRARGLDAFRAEVARVARPLAPQVEAIRAWDDVKLLSVALDRLERWHRPGLLVIGDAAHALSPIGGVGINVAIQDAVAAANILAGPMAAGADLDPLLGKVQRRRMPVVRAIQAFQSAAQKRIIAPLIARGGDAPIRPPLFVRLLDRYRLLRAIPAALIGIGPRAEHVRSPKSGCG